MHITHCSIHTAHCTLHTAHCRYMTKYQSQYGAGGTQYSYYYEEDDSTFQLVDTAGYASAPAPAPRGEV